MSSKTHPAPLSVSSSFPAAAITSAMTFSVGAAMPLLMVFLFPQIALWLPKAIGW